MFSNTNHKFYRSEDPIDLTSTGTYTIETTETDAENNRRFVPGGSAYEVTAEDNVATPAFISIGTNSPNYNNIAPAQYLGGALNELLGLVVAAPNVMPIIPEGTEIKLKVIAPALGLGVAYEIKPVVHGFDLIF